MLPYDGELVRVELDNNQLDQILERATEGWSGKGNWLQISGFAFQHDPRKVEGHRVDAISLLQDGKMMKLPDRPLQAVTYKFLIEGGDGYDMLKPLQWSSVAGSLKERLRQILRGSRSRFSLELMVEFVIWQNFTNGLVHSKLKLPHNVLVV